MRAIKLEKAGGVDQLKYINIELPTIKQGEVLVNIKALSINPIDVKTRMGKGVYELIKHELLIVLGWDIAGVIVESKNDAFKVGDEVFGMVNFPGNGNTYAEYIKVNPSQLTLKPKNVSFEEAAASTLAALTAWQALVTNANVQKDQNILIHAASGGVGHFAVQIAKHLGATVTGTSSSRNKEFVLGLGADTHIDYQGYDWSSHGRKFDVVLDAIGGENIDNSIAVTKEGGVIVSIPTGKSEYVTEKAKPYGIIGKHIRVETSGLDTRNIASLLEKGALKPYVSKVFSFDEMPDAHRQQETGRTIGKIVIRL